MKATRAHKINGYGLRKGLKGGKTSNIKQLAEDFVKSVSFGKASPPKSADEIRKKFSI